MTNEISAVKTYVPQKNTGIETLDSIEHNGALLVSVGSFTFNSSLTLVMTGYLDTVSGTGSDGSSVHSTFGVGLADNTTFNISAGCTEANHLVIRTSSANNANWFPVINRSPMTYGTYKLQLTGTNENVTSVSLYFNDELLQTKTPETKTVTGNVVSFVGGKRLAKSKITSAKVYVDDGLVRDLVPAYNHATSKYGLIDALTDAFYSQVTTIDPSNVTPTPALNYIISVSNYKVTVPARQLFTDPITQNTYELLSSIEATQEKDAGGVYGQWIDTELYMEGNDRDTITNANDIFEIRGRITELEEDTRWIIGFHNSGRYVRFGTQKINDNIYYVGADGYWNDGSTSTGALADTNTHTFILNHKRNSLSIDGTEYALKDGLNSTNRGTATQVTSRGNTITFLGYKHDSKYQVGSGAKFIIEYIKIYRQNGTVRGNFIPAKSIATGEIGMFDTVNNQFVKNGNPAESAVPFISHELTVYADANKTFVNN